MSQIFTLTSDSTENDVDEAVHAVIQAVVNGELAVIPTDTSYALIADAFNESAIERMRIAKQQSSSVSIPVGVGSLATVDGIATLSTLARDLVTALWPGALTVLTKPQPSVSLAVCQVGDAVAVRVPSHPIALAVIQGIGPVAMTGAQVAGEAPITTIIQAQAALGDSVTTYIDGGELTAKQSTVLDATSEHLRLIRRGALSIDQLRAVVPMVIDAAATQSNDETSSFSPESG